MNLSAKEAESAKEAAESAKEAAQSNFFNPKLVNPKTP
jgi:hypothetical protein